MLSPGKILTCVLILSAPISLKGSETSTLDNDQFTKLSVILMEGTQKMLRSQTQLLISQQKHLLKSVINATKYAINAHHTLVMDAMKTHQDIMERYLGNSEGLPQETTRGGALTTELQGKILKLLRYIPQKISYTLKKQEKRVNKNQAKYLNRLESQINDAMVSMRPDMQESHGITFKPASDRVQAQINFSKNIETSHAEDTSSNLKQPIKNKQQREPGSEEHAKSKDTDDSSDDKDTKNVKDVKDVNDAKDVNDVKNLKDVKAVRDTKKAQDLKVTQDKEDVEDMRDAKNVKDMKVAKDVEDVKDAKKVEDVKDAKVEDVKVVKDVEDLRDAKKLKDVKGAKYVENVEYAKYVRGNNKKRIKNEDRKMKKKSQDDEEEEDDVDDDDDDDADDEDADDESR